MGRLKRDAKGQRIKIGVCVECKKPNQRLNHYGFCEPCREKAYQARQVALKNAVQRLNTDIGVSTRLKRLRSQDFSCRDIAEHYGRHITPADIHRASVGVEPKDPDKRAVLGYPVLKPAPVCPSCNVVHMKACPSKRKGRKRRRLIAQVDEALYNRIKDEAARRGVAMAEVVRERMEG